VSSLRSSDPQTRKEAVQKISDDKELFFIAMNIGVGIKGQWPDFYQTTHLRPGEYPEDVRVMAVKKIKDVAYLICCATWNDGDFYNDEGMSAGRFDYKGKTYHVNHDKLYEKVSPGDAVRNAAKERLCSSNMLRDAAKCINNDVRRRLLPSRDKVNGSHDLYEAQKGTAFINDYGMIKVNNPINILFADIIANQTSLANLIAFVYNASEMGPVIASTAYNDAVMKLNRIPSKVAVGLFKKMYLRSTGSSGKREAGKERVGRVAQIKNGPSRNAGPGKWVWAIYQYIDDPSEEIVIEALKNCDPSDAVKILGKVKHQEIYLKIFGGVDLVDQVAEDKRQRMSTSFGGEQKDLKLDAAREMLKPVVKDDVLETLALKAQLYSIRYAAIDKITSEDVLSKVACDTMDNCPYDTSLKGCEMFDDGLKWASATKEKSAFQLRSLAINKMKDPSALKALRKADKSIAIKKNVTERLQALGFSDVQEIVGYEKYDKDLFSMFAEIKGNEEFIKIANDAKLKGVRLLAASKLGSSAFAEIAKKEASKNTGRPEKGKLVVGGYYLGMNIEDMLAKLAAEQTAVMPIIYLDGEVLCIADNTGRDIAWANAVGRNVRWITLPVSVVKNIVGFESGSFENLERAIERKIGISFGFDVIRKGEVSQKIGNLENTEGETLRFFKSDLSTGEDFSRSVRKAVNTNSVGGDPFGALGAGLANAFEDAMQADENRANARNPMFQQQGAVQLLYTKDAVKGSLGATGSLQTSFSSAIGNAFKSAVNANENIKEINRGIDELKKAGGEIEDMRNKLDDAVNQLKNLSL
jgi:hypothetical protein